MICISAVYISHCYHVGCIHIYTPTAFTFERTFSFIHLYRNCRLIIPLNILKSKFCSTKVITGMSTARNENSNICFASNKQGILF